MNKRIFLFDLDGTVTDPKKGITRSVQYSLRHFGINVEDADTLTRFIGPPLRDSYKRFYGFDNLMAEEAVAQYREYFADRGIFENVLYDGMDTLLKRLCNDGKTVLLATSKPQKYAMRILEHFAIAEFFTFAAGSELDGRRSRKSEVIEYALDSAGIADKTDAVMIGDREHDIIGANECGIESIGVLYGYGSREELETAGAAALAGSVAELSELLL